MPKKIRYAVAGLGWVAQSAVLPGFASARDNSELVALVSGSKDKLATLGKHYQVPELCLTADYEELMRSGSVDAVYLAVPNDKHERYTQIAARYGVHVLCEKPMATDEDSCRRMIKACQAGKVEFMMAYRLHLHPAFLRAVALVRAGAIGDVRLFDAHFVEQIPEGDIRLDQRNAAGPLDYSGIYCVNAARTLFGDEPTRAGAFGAREGSGKFSAVPEMVAAFLQFSRGRMATFTCSFNLPYRAHFRVSGTGGDIFVDRAFAMHGEMRLTLTQAGQAPATTVYAANDQFGAEVYYFSDCLLNAVTPQPSAMEGLADVRCLRALQTAMEQGTPLDLAPIYPDRRPDPEQALNFPPVAKPPLYGVAEPFTTAH